MGGILHTVRISQIPRSGSAQSDENAVEEAIIQPTFVQQKKTLPVFPMMSGQVGQDSQTFTVRAHWSAVPLLRLPFALRKNEKHSVSSHNHTKKKHAEPHEKEDGIQNLLQFLRHFRALRADESGSRALQIKLFEEVFGCCGLTLMALDLIPVFFPQSLFLVEFHL